MTRFFYSIFWIVIFCFQGHSQTRSASNEVLKVPLEYEDREATQRLHHQFNKAMYHWTKNDFSTAFPIISVHDANLDAFTADSYPWLRLNEATEVLRAEQSNMFFISRRTARFMENTRRTKHSYLCENNSCEDYAWNAIQRTQNSGARHMLFARRIRSSIDVTDITYMNLLTELKDLAGALENDLKVPHNSSRDTIKNYRQKRQFLLEELWQKSPDLKYWDPLFVPEISEVQSVLQENEYILSFSYVLNCRRPIAFLIGKTNVKFQRVGTAHKDCSTDYHKYAVFSLQKSMASDAIHKIDGQLPLEWLGQNLLKESFMPPTGSRLYIVPDGSLSAVPFEWIEYQKKKLYDQYQVIYLPSASFLYAKRKDNDINHSYSIEFLGVGRSLHEAGGNVDTKRYLDQAKSYFTDEITIPNASEQQVLTMSSLASDAKHIALFTHSAFTKPNQSFLTDDGTPLLSLKDTKDRIMGLAFGKTLESDGVITASELFATTNLKAKTVLVIACDSNGSLSNKSVSETFSDLALTALSSGAENVIVTRWPVNAELAGDFLELYAEIVATGVEPYAAYEEVLDNLVDQDDPQRYAWMFISSGIGFSNYD